MTEKELRERQQAFKDASRGKPCAVCGSRLFVESHHVVYKQVVRKIAESAGQDPDEVMWDVRDALPVCTVCHARHHSGAARIPRPLLVAKAPQAFQFARELGPVAIAHIKRSYPMTAPTS